MKQIEFRPLPPPEPDFQKFVAYLEDSVAAAVGLPPEFFDDDRHPDERAFAE